MYNMYNMSSKLFKPVMMKGATATFACILSQKSHFSIKPYIPKQYHFMMIDKKKKYNTYRAGLRRRLLVSRNKKTPINYIQPK